MEVEETILVLVEIAKHVEAFSFADVVHHVVLQELVDIIGGDLAKLHSVDALESSPGLKAMLLGQLLALLLDNLLILSDRTEQLEHFVTSRLCEHFNGALR